MRRGLAVLMAMVAVTAGPSLVPLPAVAADKHLGVKACAESSCHGANQPSALAMVQQDEYRIWRQQDAHAKAYQVLGTAAAKAISRKLGLGDPQQEARCLDCHSDHVPPARRGKHFSLADGVSCEACHGPAERWLGDHSNGRSHAENVQAGMFPTEDPLQRARLCFGCHMGSSEKPMTHRLLGAGHPRLTIELDTFTMARPAHHREDRDWHQRKPGNSTLRTWAIGQAQSSVQWLALARVQASKPDGLLPEFTLFDCHGCHRRMGRGSASGGQPQINNSSVQMLNLLAQRVAPEQAAELQRLLRLLESASDHAGLAAALNALAPAAARVAGACNQYRYERADAQAWAQSLLRSAGDGQYSAHANAEQATYALSVLIEALDGYGALSRRPEVENALEGLYTAAQDGDRFDAGAWRSAAARLEQKLAAVLK